MFLVDGRSKSGAGWPTFAISGAFVSNAFAVPVDILFIAPYEFIATEQTESTEEEFE
jgi:hypothetical protein